MNPRVLLLLRHLSFGHHVPSPALRWILCWGVICWSIIIGVGCGGGVDSPKVYAIEAIEVPTSGHFKGPSPFPGTLWKKQRQEGSALPERLLARSYQGLFPHINKVKPRHSYAHRAHPVYDPTRGGLWIQRSGEHSGGLRGSVELALWPTDPAERIRVIPLSDHLAVPPYVSSSTVIVATRDGWIRSYNISSTNSKWNTKIDGRHGAAGVSLGASGSVSTSLQPDSPVEEEIQLTWAREMSTYPVHDFIIDVHRGSLFTSLAGGQVVRLSLSTGETNWVASLQNQPRQILVDPAAMSLSPEGQLWVGGTGGLEIFDASHGEWQMTLSSPEYSSPRNSSSGLIVPRAPRGALAPWVRDDQSVTVVRYGGGITTYSLTRRGDGSSPKVRWHQDLPGYVISAVRLDDELFLGTLEGDVLVWNIVQNHMTHSLALSRSAITQVAVLDDTSILALGRDGEIMGFSAITKKPLFYKETPNSFYARAVITDSSMAASGGAKRIHLTTSYNNIYTFSRVINLGATKAASGRSNSSQPEYRHQRVPVAQAPR